MAKKGGKLTKSESVQVRFDPLVKWAAEILAADQRRSLSSLVEWAVEKAVQQIDVYCGSQEKAPLTAWDVAVKCWHINPVWRLYKLSENFPELLTFDDRNRWEIVRYLVYVEREINPREPIGGQFIDPAWLAGLTAVWPYIVEHAGHDFDWAELREKYLKARTP